MISACDCANQPPSTTEGAPKTPVKHRKKGSGDQPGNQPGDKPGDQPGDQPGDKPGDKPGDQPGDQPGDKPGDKPEDKSEDQPEDKPEDKPEEDQLHSDTASVDSLNMAKFNELNKKDFNGNNLLNRLIYGGDHELAKLLINKIETLDKSALNDKNSNGYTPLHQILVHLKTGGGGVNANKDIVSIQLAKLLIEKLDRSELEEEDNWQHTPLYYAQQITKYPELAQLLKQKLGY